MSHTLASIRRYPNHELYKLKLVRTGPPLDPEDPKKTYPNQTFLVAVLTQKAVNLGVQFDNYQNDFQFDLTQNLGFSKEYPNLVEGTGFDAVFTNIRLDLADRDHRSLLVDLPEEHGGTTVTYDLDEHLCLVDYFNISREEIFFRLGKKSPRLLKKSLVLCFDGTSNHFSKENTNVVKLVEILKKDHTDEQMVYYQTGVGTYTSPAWTSSITQTVAKTVDEGVAWYLYQHVIDGYKFLMESYQAGDRIYIFGFSRGAFTARALAGMLHCVGLLPKHNTEHIPFAYEVYSKTNSDELKPTGLKGAESVDFNEDLRAEPNPDNDWIPDEEVPDSVMPSEVPLNEYQPERSIETPPHNPLKRVGRTNGFGALGAEGGKTATEADPEAYKQTFCNPIQIDFVGVWDTVASVGGLTSTILPFIDYNPSIRVFRHALALDERRAKFVPSLWDHACTTKYQNVREVWFRGNHSDIGGGTALPKPTNLGGTRLPSDPKFTVLSNIALRWMLQQCFENNTHMKFDYESTRLYREEGVLERRLISDERPTVFNYDGPPIEEIPQPKVEGAETEPEVVEPEPEAPEQEPEVDPLGGQSQEENILYLPEGFSYKSYCALDQIDIKHNPNETMTMGSPWWLLELLPSNRPAQPEDGYFTARKPNLGQAREIRRRRPTDEIYLHDSVVNYILSKPGQGYEPRATWHGYEGEFPMIDSYVHRLYSRGHSDNTRFIIDNKLFKALRLKTKQQVEDEKKAEEEKAKRAAASYMGKAKAFFGLG